MLTQLGRLDRFKSGSKSTQAELILWCLYESTGKQGIALQRILEAFEELELPRANATRTREHFKKSRKVRKLGKDVYAPTRDLIEELDGLIHFDKALPDNVLDIEAISLPPFVDEDRQRDLTKMVRVYAHLFLLENSMRGLIEKVLSDHLGDTWWDIAASSPMKNKHQKRVDNETAKKWAPTRSEYGPLYALDWSDLVRLMRKYPEQFEPWLGDINFLHRFEDAGTFRNVVAHNGVLSEQDDFELIRIYYQNWVSQISGSA